MILGALEVRFEDQEEVKKEIENLQDYIAKSEMIFAAIRFGRLKERLKKLNIKEDEDIRKLQDWISSKENQVTLEASVEELGLSVRALNCLVRRGIRTVEQLTQMSLEDLKKVRNMDQKSIANIVNRLNEFGLKLSSDE